MTNDLVSGASQIAAALAQRSRPGFSSDPADYRLPFTKFTGDEFDPMAPRYRPDIDPLGFLIGRNVIGAEGVPVIILNKLSGWEEKRDEMSPSGERKSIRVAIWKSQPQDTKAVRGKGGGLLRDNKDRMSRFGEIFIVANGELIVSSLYDQHDLLTSLDQQAMSLPVKAFYEIKWQLTKKEIADGDYTRTLPHFELLGIAGEPNGPTAAEIEQAKRLYALVAHVSYPSPDIPLRLVVGGDIGSPPEPPAPPVQSIDDYDSDIPF